MTGVQTCALPICQGTELLKRQLTVNEDFWNLVVAESVRSDGRGNPGSEAVASASAKSADAAMRLRLFSAYGTAATEAIAGRRVATGVNPTGRVMAGRVESPVTTPELSLAA